MSVDKAVMYLDGTLAGIEKAVNIYLSPTELRQAADFLEKETGKCRMGDPLPEVVLFGNDGHMRISIRWQGAGG